MRECRFLQSLAWTSASGRIKIFVEPTKFRVARAAAKPLDVNNVKGSGNVLIHDNGGGVMSHGEGGVTSSIEGKRRCNSTVWVGNGAYGGELEVIP